MYQQPPILCKEEVPEEDSPLKQQQQQTTGPNQPNEEPISEFRNQNSDKEDGLLNFQQNSFSSNQKGQDSKKSPEQNPKTKPGFIRMFHIKNFISKLLKVRNQVTKLTKYHIEVINDKASSYNQNLLRQNALKLQPIMASFQTMNTLQKQKRQTHSPFKGKQLFLQFIANCSKIIHQVPLVHPESKIKIIWECLMAVVRLYLIYIIPIDLAWDTNQFIYDILVVPTTISIILLGIDFFFSLFQSFYHKGQLVTSRKSIALHVVSKAYGMELASILVLIIFLILTKGYDMRFILAEDTQYILIALSFVQYNNIALLRQQMEDALNLSKAASSLVQLGKLFFLLFYVIHLFACIWYWVGNISHQYLGTSWLQARGLVNSSFGDQYLVAFYYSTVTMFTVGYGDILPQSNPELIVAIIFMMICSVQLSYSVSTVGAIIDKISAFKEEKQRKFHIINSYMQNRDISYELQFQVREYLNYYWQDQNLEETQQEDEIIDQLSARLREKLVYEANSRIINSFSLFKKSFSENVKKELVKKIKSVYIPPENILDFSKLTNEIEDYISICFIESGSIKVMIENEDESVLSSIQLLEQGEGFGFLSFISGQQSIEKYKTVGFTKLLILSRKDFLQIIKKYPQDYEMFCQFYDDLQHNQLQNYFPVKCFSCQASNHKVLFCPLLHFVADKEKIIKQAQFDQIQQRNNQHNVRLNNRIKSKSRATVEQPIIEEVALQIQDNCWIYTQLYDEFTSEFRYNILQDKQIVNQAQSIQASPNKNLAIPTPNIIVSSYKDVGNRQALKNKRSMPTITEEQKKIDKKVSIRNKFRKIVQQIEKQEKQQDKEQYQDISEINQFDQQQIDQIEILMKLQLIDVQDRKARIQQYQQFLDDKQIINDLDFIEAKLKLIQGQIEDLHFDSMKSFKYFQTNYNIESVISRQLQVKCLTQDQKSKLANIRDKLIKYMIYPQQYIEKYYQLTNTMQYQDRNKKLKKLRRVNRISIALLNQRTLKKK